jgi:hypothetical protein
LPFIDGAPRFEKATVSGCELEVITNLSPSAKVILTTENGLPLIAKIAYGRGEITFFTAKAYPANEAIKPLYENELGKLASEAVASEEIFAEASSGVEFAVYDRDSERDVYFLAVDWYRAPEILRHAKLIIGKNEHEISLPFGVMIKASVSGGFAAYPDSENAEVISVKDGIARLQGTGRVKFTFIKGKESYTKEIDFSSVSYQEFKI